VIGWTGIGQSRRAARAAERRCDMVIYDGAEVDETDLRIVTVWDRPGKRGRKREVRLLSQFCCVAGVESWDAVFPDGTIRTVSIPRE